MHSHAGKQWIRSQDVDRNLLSEQIGWIIKCVAGATEWRIEEREHSGAMCMQFGMEMTGCQKKNVAMKEVYFLS